jgi:uncharacterized membrane protein YdjX (TVP38/TMEM64 family)
LEIRPNTLRNARIAAVLVVIVLLVVAQRLGVFEQVKDPAHLTQSIAALGAWGFVVFVLAYAALQPFGVPGTVFVVAAPLIWPWPIAFCVSMVGTMAASVIGFSFARFVARDWVAARIPGRFRKYERALEERAFLTVFLLRFIFWMPQVLHAFLGVSKVRFWTHFWGSLAGYVVPLLLVSYFGQKVLDAMKDAPPSVWIALGAAAAVIALGVWAVKRWKAGGARA